MTGVGTVGTVAPYSELGPRAFLIAHSGTAHTEFTVNKTCMSSLTQVYSASKTWLGDAAQQGSPTKLCLTLSREAPRCHQTREAPKGHQTRTHDAGDT